MPGPQIDLPGTIVPIKIGAKGLTKNEFAGTSGESLRMEGFELNLVDPR